jgi:hypothetical protein
MFSESIFIKYENPVASVSILSTSSLVSETSTPLLLSSFFTFFDTSYSMALSFSRALLKVSTCNALILTFPSTMACQSFKARHPVYKMPVLESKAAELNFGATCPVTPEVVVTTPLS